MNNKYQIELEEFREKFKKFYNFKIVLYGIGRYTATLLEGLHDFQFVGLMDKNPDNFGKEMFGLPIIDKKTAEQIADMVVINTSETYWDIIFERIEDMNIPVYYRNGKKAEKRIDKKITNPYKHLSRKRLEEKIENAEIISFDFFDTLFMRKVCSPKDVFGMIQKEICEIWTFEETYLETRNHAIKQLEESYTWDELYEVIGQRAHLSDKEIRMIKDKEIDIEKRLLFPRRDILEVFRDCIYAGKEVYLISDMYLPKSIYIDLLNAYKIEIDEDKILISNEIKMSKADGSLWAWYAEKIVNNRRALHIGDNEKADVQLPFEYGIQTYLTPNPWDMLKNSSLADVCANITTENDSVMMGNILYRLFENPYVFSGDTNIVKINTDEDMGYTVFGPIILTFLLWLVQQNDKSKIERFVFMARDGFLLIEDFEYLCKLLKRKVESVYIMISRQLAMVAAIETRDDLREYINMPYSGTVSELMEDRVGLCVKDEMLTRESVYQYENDFYIELRKLRERYLVYLDSFHFTNSCAVVDLGYYGNNQKYLNKLCGLHMSGYYFNANYSKQNPNAMEQDMYACFQNENDILGENSQILKKMIFLESFLTAPYGMVKGISEHGEFIYAKEGNNQKFFGNKLAINEGVKQFMSDYIKIMGKINLELSPEFADVYYGVCFGGHLEIAEDVKKSFWNDNAMMNRIESELFA